MRFETSKRIHTATRWPIDGALSTAYTDLAYCACLERIHREAGVEFNVRETVALERLKIAAERVAVRGMREAK